MEGWTPSFWLYIGRLRKGNHTGLCLLDGCVSGKTEKKKKNLTAAFFRIINLNVKQRTHRKRKNARNHGRLQEQMAYRHRAANTNGDELASLN
jgi:hypothetical protein